MKGVHSYGTDDCNSKDTNMIRKKFYLMKPYLPIVMPVIMFQSMYSAHMT